MRGEIIQTRDLTVEVIDNRPLVDHYCSYNGLASLVHREQGVNIFVPGYAGLNYEANTVPGVVDYNRSIAMEPRYSRMEMERVSPASVRLRQAPTPLKQVEAEITFTAVEPYYIDFTVGYCLRLVTAPGDYTATWASYMNDPGDTCLYIPGHTASDARTRWLRLWKESHGEHNPMVVQELGRTGRPDNPMLVQDADALERNSESLRNGTAEFTWDAPVYYALFRGFAFILMFSDPNGVELVYSPTGGIGFPYPTPAWDFRHRVTDPEQNRWYRFAGRLAYKQFAGPDDVMTEYEAWNAGARSNRMEQYYP